MAHGTSPPSPSARSATWHGWTLASNRWSTASQASRPSSRTPPDEVRRLADTVDHDASTLAALEERLGLIYALERRYGDDEEAVIAHGERARAEVERLAGLEDERARREAEDATLLAAVADVAGRLSDARRSAAADLASAVGAVLVELGFPAGVFEVALGRRPAGADEPAVELDGDAVAFDAAGADQVVYRLAPEPG